MSTLWKGDVIFRGWRQCSGVVWTKRKRGVVGVPPRDAASEVVLDLREFCAVGRREG